MARGTLVRCCCSVTAVTLAALVPVQPSAAANCLWAGGPGNFNDKNKWANCRPGKKDNAEIGVSWINPPTGIVEIATSVELHNLYINTGSTVNLRYALAMYGNDLYNGGTLNLYTLPIQSYFRSYSKNLQIFGAGAIRLSSGSKMSGNITFGFGQFVHGSGIIGEESNLLSNNGTMQADQAGDEILFARGIDGTGTFRSQGGGRLHFTGESSGDYLMNNGLVELDNVNFTVAKDYQGAYFGNGNEFDARRTVQGTGQILAADARQVVSGPRLSGNVMDFGAMHVGAVARTSLTVTNSGGLTTLRGAVQTNGTPNVKVTNANFTLDPGGDSQTSYLDYSAITSGSFLGQPIDVVNNFSNVADDHLVVKADVYAYAVSSLSSYLVEFGTVRRDTAGVLAGATIGNAAVGALTDTLISSVGATPANITILSVPGPLAAGAAGNATFGLATDIAGVVGGNTTVGFTSSNPQLGDVMLASKFLSFTGTVTDPAVATLLMHSGAGLFAGGNGVYTLDLGSLRQGGTASTEFAVLNSVLSAAYAETLAGSFTLAAGPGFSFVGNSFNGLEGGASDIGNWLSFDAHGLSAGIYSGVLTFHGLSHYAGLDDLALAPIQLNFSAAVNSVPEPASWILMIAGFGAIGITLRTRPRQSSSVWSM